MIEIVTVENNLKKLFDRKKNLFVCDTSYENIEGLGNYYIVKIENQFGLFTNDGTLALDCIYDSIEYLDFSNSIIFTKDDKKGFLSMNGKKSKFYDEVIPIKDSSSDGHFFYLTNSIKDCEVFYSILWKSNDSVLMACKKIVYLGFKLFIYQFGDKYGLMDLDKNSILDCTFSKINFYPNEKRIISIDHLGYQLRRLNGKLVKKDRYNFLSDIVSGSIIANKDGIKGLIDINGKFIPGFNSIDNYIPDRSFDDEGIVEILIDDDNVNELGFQIIKKGQLYGLVNHRKKLILEPCSKIKFHFRNGYSVFKGSNNLYGLIDSNLNVIQEPQFKVFELSFDHYYEFIFDPMDIEKLRIPFIVKFPKKQKFGLMSHNGKWIHKPTFKKINVNDSSNLRWDEMKLLIFNTKSEMGVMNLEGKECFRGNFAIQVFDYFYISDGDYDNEVTEYWHNDSNSRLDDNSNFCIEQNHLKGLMDLEGKWVLEPKYEYIEGFRDGFCRAQLNGKIGKIDKDGNWEEAKSLMDF
jgi:hypothetical protein